MQTDILDRRPDNRQATGLRREYINLVGALSDITLRDSQWHWWSECADASSEETHKTSRGALHPQRGFAPPLDSVECTWRVKAASCVKASCLLGCSQDIALLMHETALTRGCRKEFRDSGQQSVMPVSDNQIDVGGSSSPQILQQASPSIFILLGAGAPRQELFVACQIYP
jgi:hypothetical protein